MIRIVFELFVLLFRITLYVSGALFIALPQLIWRAIKKLTRI